MNGAVTRSEVSAGARLPTKPKSGCTGLHYALRPPMAGARLWGETMLTDGERLDYLCRELELVEGVIARLASNSFTIKGWSLTLITGSLILNADGGGAFVAFVPLVGFWILDATYLRRERLFRKLYDFKAANRLSTDAGPFAMDVSRFNADVPSVPATMFTSSLVWFYAPIAVMTLALACLNIG